ncbi:hypothetical protein V6N11_077292 [Hibiscus sabdariffa]|uniref:Uncharacterized protein n=1 Tax=Hibiscus sabdariffa TaxID=183260 RepID=A0ABR2TCN6_9ROSI
MSAKSVVAIVSGCIADGAKPVDEAPVSGLGANIGYDVARLMGCSTHEDFPPLQSSKQRGKGKGGKGRKVVAFVSSKNKFEVLNGVGSKVSEELRKSRAASLGVATLLQEIQEMKVKKVEKVQVRVPEVAGQVGSVPNSQ